MAVNNPNPGPVLDEKQTAAVAAASATHGLGVPDHDGQFRVFCPQQANGCGYISPVASASTQHAPAVCPVCGHSLVVLSEDEQRSTPGVLEAIADKEGATALKSTSTPTTAKDDDDDKDDKKAKK